MQNDWAGAQPFPRRRLPHLWVFSWVVIFPGERSASFPCLGRCQPGCQHSGSHVRDRGSESHLARYRLPLNPPLSAALPAFSLCLTSESLNSAPSHVLLACGVGSDTGPNFFIYRISTHLSGFSPPLAITGTAIPEIPQCANAGFYFLASCVASGMVSAFPGLLHQLATAHLLFGFQN